MIKQRFFFVVIFGLFLGGLLYADAPSGFRFVGEEGDTVYLNEVGTVAYGANGVFIYREQLSGSLEITNWFFQEDPVPGVRKAAYFRSDGFVDHQEIERQTDIARQQYPDFLYLGQTGDTVILNDQSILAYGKDGRYTLVSNVIGQFRLTNDLLLGRASDESYYCFYASSAIVESVPENANTFGAEGPAGFQYLGYEGQTVYLPQRSIVAYGVNGTFNYLESAEGYLTLDNVLSGDPVPGERKFGFYRESEEADVPDFARDAFFSRSSVDALYDSALRTGDYRDFYLSATGWINRSIENAESDRAKTRLIGDPDFSRLLARQRIISVLGVDHIMAFQTTAERRAFVRSILGNDDLIEEFLMGGAPQVRNPITDTGQKTLSIWYDIFRADRSVFTGVRRRLAMATALAFTADMMPYNSGGAAIPNVDPLVRYSYYRDAWNNKELFPEFEELTVWELRYVVTAWATEADITWAREMLRTMRPDLLNQGRIHDGAGLMPYTGNLDYPDNYRDLMTVGGVCGAVAFFGALGNQAFGVPAANLGQPGHAAFAYLAEDHTWGFGNDIFTWRQSYSEVFQGLDLAGSGRTYASYLLLATSARSDRGKFLRTRQFEWAADAAYGSETAQELRRIGLSINDKDYILWNDLIDAYKTMEDVSAGTWNDLAREYLRTYHNLPDQQAAFFDAINTPSVLGIMDESVFADCAHSMQQMFEETGFQRFDSQFSRIRTVVENKLQVELAHLRPDALSATDTSHQPGEPASNLVDGVIGSGRLWHSEYAIMGTLPQSVDIDFDKSYRINRIAYVPRQDGGHNGIVTRFELLGTTNGRTYSLIEAGTWEHNHETKTVDCGNRELTGIRLIVREGVGGFTSGEEILIYTDRAIPSGSGILSVTADYFPYHAEDRTEVLSGVQQERFPDSSRAHVVFAEDSRDLRNTHLVSGYTGTTQAQIGDNGTITFPLPSGFQGNYQLQIVYATPYSTGRMAVTAGGYTNEYALTNSGGLWRKSNPLGIWVAGEQRTVTLSIRNAPLAVVQRILVSR